MADSSKSPHGSTSMPVHKSILWVALLIALMIYGTASAARHQFSTIGELAPDDFRISHMGPDGLSNYSGRDPTAAYNAKRDQYLVVWLGRDEAQGTGEREVWGRLVDGSTGALIGDQIQISRMGPDGDSDYMVNFPDAAYNSNRDEFLVVWQGNDYKSGFREDFEIWGQRLVYNAGALVEEGDEFKISQMGPVAPAADAQSYRAYEPAVDYNSDPGIDEYLVVWHGNDQAAGLGQNEHEIFGQRLGYNGLDAMVEKGRDDFRISYMGPSNNDDYRASSPDVVYNSTRKEYLVVWWGDSDSFGLVENEYEIWGKRVQWDDSPAGPQQRISDMGADGNYSYAAYDPAAAYNPGADQYLVVWSGAEELGDPFGLMLEVYGQMLHYDALGDLAEVVPNDFQITYLQQEGYRMDRALDPVAAYNTRSDLFLVLWHGDYDLPPLARGEFEIYGQLVDSESSLLQPLEFRLSQVGQDGDVEHDADSPAVAAGKGHSFLAVWHSNPGTAPLSQVEQEIFGQFYTSLTPDLLPVIMK